MKTTEAELDKLLKQAKAADPIPYKACGDGDRHCKCGLIWSVPLDMSILIAHRAEDSEDINPGCSATTDYIVAACNIAPSLAVELKEARQRIADLEEVQVCEAGFKPIGLDNHGELEVEIDINGRPAHIFLSKEFWEACTTKYFPQ